MQKIVTVVMEGGHVLTDKQVEDAIRTGIKMQTLMAVRRGLGIQGRMNEELVEIVLSKLEVRIENAPA